MHISDVELKQVQAILRRHLPADAHVLVYGSRSHGRNLKPFSDLDLCLRAPAQIPAEVMARLRQSFEDSDLPYQVDIVDWSQLRPEFRAAISKDLLPLALYQVAERPR